MSILSYLLKHEFQLYLQVERQIDSRVSPKSLIKQLQNKKILKKFIKCLNSPTKNDYKIIRRLHICNLLLLYSNNFYEVFNNHVEIPLSSDEWLNQQVILPFIKFLTKCSTSDQLYSLCKKSQIKSNNFEMLFFTINSLKQLFKSTSKLSLLGKFYLIKSRQVFQGLVQMMAVQSKQLYFSLKNFLTTILMNPQQYLLTNQYQNILKHILLNDLSQINEQMKMLLLGKQFYPYGKSIGIKLFRIDQATYQLESTIKGIVTDHLETNRRRQKLQIQQHLFGDHKDHNHIGFNLKYFQETLDNFTPLISGLSAKQNRFNKFKFNKKDDQVVLSDDQNQQQFDLAKVLPDTDQSNFNKNNNI